MKNLLVVGVSSILVLLPIPVSAIGMGDLVGAGIHVVGQIGGAVIDKAMEDSPEEKARKQEKEKQEHDAKFKEVIAKIEERRDISPLEKEKLTRAAARNFGAAETISNLAVQQELQRKAQRDQMLTAGGIAGVVGGAAMNTPSVMMAKADLMVKAGIPQAQSRAAINGANDLMKTGRPQAQSKAAVDAATIAMNGGKVDVPAAGDVQLGGTAQDRAAAEAGVMDAISQNQGEIDKAKAVVEAAKPKELPSVPQVANLSTMDMGRKVYVEFVGSKKLTDRLVQAFKDNGHDVVESEKEAEVVYQFDADYAIAEEPSREGTIIRVGQFVEEGKAIELKPKGASVKQMVGGFLLAMGGKAVPERKDSGLYRQAALFVANRHAEGKDMRIAERFHTETAELNAVPFIDGALLDMMDKVGVPGKSILKAELTLLPAN